MLTQKKVKRIYGVLLKEIQRLVSHGDYSEALSTIDTFALVAEKVNDIFREDVIENVLRYIGETQIKPKSITTSNSSIKRIVFYDQIGTTICLSLQYLRALKSLGYEILYIFERKDSVIDPNLKREVENICTQTVYYNCEYSIETAKNIQQLIIKYEAPKLIAHSPCFGAMGSSIFYSLSGIQKYRIIPGDHHFYVGIDCIDHFIEFRDFGINVSINERKIPIEKVNCLPYYPIVESNIPFQGFPDYVTGKLIIGAAAREVKFHGSDRFFKMSEYILNNYENVVILFIGGKSKKVLDFVDKHHLQNRFIVLGYRNDFIECMKHIDIFFNSYPWGSALSSMTAAYFSKPIISYHDQLFDLESLNSWIVPQNGKEFSYSNDDDLKDYINKLIIDDRFRLMEGARVKESICNPIHFATSLDNILEGKQLLTEFVKLPPKVLVERTNMYLDCQNTFSPKILYYLNKTYGYRFFLMFPFLLYDRIKYFCKLRVETLYSQLSQLFK